MAETERRTTRRALLRDAARLAGGARLSVLAARASGVQTAPAASQAASRPAPAKARVIQTSLANVFVGPTLKPDLLDVMVSETLAAVTGRSTAEDAWHAILREGDVVGLKFNRSGEAVLGTTPVLARVLVQSLGRAGWPAEKIVLIEAPPSLVAALGTRPAAAGWSDETVDFGSGRDRFAAVLDQITALVNVPFLKTHNIAGMTGCLKNLSHALVRQPARYHANRCSPFIADIVAADPIRRKLRLNLVNALCAVVDEGPEVGPNHVWQSRTLLASFDPVAADTIGLELLNAERKHRRLPVLDDDATPILFLGDAQRRGLGTASLDDIQVVPANL